MRAYLFLTIGLGEGGNDLHYHDLAVLLETDVGRFTINHVQGREQLEKMGLQLRTIERLEIEIEHDRCKRDDDDDKGGDDNDDGRGDGDVDAVLLRSKKSKSEARERKDLDREVEELG
ncbi:hypothetical protein ACLOJK_019931 [Asimina triloba]